MRVVAVATPQGKPSAGTIPLAAQQRGTGIRVTFARYCKPNVIKHDLFKR
jgi:hypothetical protein